MSQLLPSLQALFVAFLWSTSFILIKIGLEEIPALTFAGLRYTLAVVVLTLVAVSRPRARSAIRALDRADWVRLALLGVVMYSATQGLQFLALSLLPANSVSLVLSFTPVLVALASSGLLGERIRPPQWLGIGAMVAGAAIFLLPVPRANVVGLGVALLGTVSNAAASLIGRWVNRQTRSHPLAVTVVSMGFGAPVMLGIGLSFEAAPDLTLRGWAIVAWLALINTAFAFTLWNHTLRRLSAVGSSVINNTMLAQIAILAWIFLGERPPLWRLAGIGLTVVGMLVVTGAGLVVGAKRFRGRTAH